jgi:hypothetical protein
VKTLLLLAASVLWTDPGSIQSLDLAGGPGGRAGAPKPPFVFNSEDPGGTSPKIIVTDGNRRKWTVKFGPEVKAETFATRIVWAAGFFAEPDYYVPNGRIESVGKLTRAAAFVDNGHFRDARFELRDNMSIHYLPGRKWSFDDVKDSPEAGMLKALVALLGNWDIKAENFAIIEANGTERYAITDWGATMGRAEDITGRSKWNCSAYSKDSDQFVQDVENGFVVLNYAGKERHIINQGVHVEDAKRLAGLLSKLTDQQLRSALQVSGATPEEVSCFAPAFRKRVGQLATAGQVSPQGEVIRSRKVTKKTIEVQPARPQ